MTQPDEREFAAAGGRGSADAGPELYPMFLDMSGRSALVVGGGPVAQRKSETLVRAGARVTVVSPSVTTELADMERGGALMIARRAFEPADAMGRSLVFAATGVADIDASIAAVARASGAFVNVADDASNSDFLVPAGGRRGAIQVAVSTSGASPALAARLRDRFIASLGPEWERFADVLGRMRAIARARVSDAAVRLKALRRAANDDALLADVARNETVDAKSALDRQLAAEDADLARAESTPARAFVSLVGAGPGAPELITVLGRDRIAEADAVVYDDLVDRRMLAAARPDAELIYAGKRGWREGPARPNTGELLVTKATEGGGKRVVRLKGGDPMVFGRAGEEFATLSASGVPFEVVPGVTAALAVAASAGIPLTLRGVSNSLTLVAGNAATEPAAPATGLESAEGGELPVANLATMALAGGTLCIYMGLKGLATIAEGLVELGVASDLPVAVVSGAYTPAQQVVVGKLDDIADRVDEAGVVSPALVVVGKVVAHTIAPVGAVRSTANEGGSA